MDYKISNICSELSIGKSTIYKRINELKNNIPELNSKNNDYFYYTDTNKLFITQKGYDYIKDFNSNKNNKNNLNNNNQISIYQNQIIEMYKSRIEYLENENKKLLEIISFKEQKEFAKDVKFLGNEKSSSFISKIFNKFKNI